LNEEIESTLHRENFTLADIKKRAMALFIDTMLLSFLLNIALYDQLVMIKNPEEEINFIGEYLFHIMLMKVAYETFFIYQYGATIGKIAMKIKVLEIRTLDNPSVLSALNRAIFRIVSEMFFYLGFLWGMLDPVRQAWHDKTAKTIVVNA
jgi:uncharacterized RDD family membrane protein YckC